MRTIDRCSVPSRGIAAALLLAAAFPAAADVFTGVSLKILNEAAPPGGTIQLKVTVTEPKPIIISGSALSYGSALGMVMGIVLPGNPDAAGAAVLGPNGLVLRTVSPSGTFGLSTALPIIAVTIAVPATTPVGATAPLTLDPGASSWLGPLGFYPQAIKQGSFTAQGTLSINDVIPGGGFLPAGSIISVVGLGFQPGALVEVDGVEIASTTFVDSTRLDAVNAAGMQLDGKRVTVRNPDRTRTSYFSYLRATSLGESARPLLAATEAVYPVPPLSGALFPAAALGPGSFVGLALQNPGAAPSQVAVTLRSAAGVVASTAFTLPPRTELSRAASELFSGVVPGPDTLLVVTATAPVQMLGLLVDESAGSVAPVLPLLSF